MKDNDTVIREFNSIVNMTASELRTWLDDPQSGRAGWPKDNNSNGDGDCDGETVGHDPGRKIVSILEANPSRDPSSYTEEQTRHMRKVVGYCKRHLAQEEDMIRRKPEDEVRESKSYISLKNWGHDPLKKSKGGGGDHVEEEEEDVETGGKGAGDKRKKKATIGSTQNGGNKRRNTRQGNGAQSKDDEKEEDDGGDDHSEEDEDEDEDGADDNNDQQATNAKEDDGGQEDDDNNEDGDDDEEEEEEKGTENKDKSTNGNNGGSKAAKKGPKPGDTVSWNWGSGQPKGKVLDVKGEKTTIETKRGNEVSRNGDSQDPAVVLDTGKSKAIKFNHELNETA
ncbi:hypothetical protein N3K66_003756 [Trichothecium roseum]|uniref:Uncharacterized protein n=1 Tax=Trichothecium roseum TaxID=47278 RepID=A0ACC0V891_9HYPO|nr:hypothetical protein N3K66_003756 [Trichothecium roseum]